MRSAARPSQLSDDTNYGNYTILQMKESEVSKLSTISKFKP